MGKRLNVLNHCAAICSIMLDSRNTQIAWLCRHARNGSASAGIRQKGSDGGNMLVGVGVVQAHGVEGHVGGAGGAPGGDQGAPGGGVAAAEAEAGLNADVGEGATIFG